MWDRPQLLNTLADLLFAAGAALLLVAGVIWVLRMPVFPVRQVVVETAVQHASPLELREVLQERVRGNFFSQSVEDVRSAVEALPWVRKASVQRVWPGQLTVRFTEHVPVARWGDSPEDWVNTYGEVFSAPEPELESEEQGLTLPRLQGPGGAAPAILKRYGEFAAILQPLGLKPVTVLVSGRQAVGLELDNGMWLELGREQSPLQLNQRLKRFVEMYPDLIAGRVPLPKTVDLRYPNGFALSSEARLSESRGKE